MLKLSLLAMTLPLAQFLSSCPLLTPTSTTIELVNDTDFPVEIEMYLGESQETGEALLRSFGEEINQTIAAGETVTLTRDCDQLQAFFIDNAEVSIIGEIGPTEDTRIYRDGSDFGCGDTIRVRFSSPTLPVSLDITVTPLTN